MSGMKKVSMAILAAMALLVMGCPMPPNIANGGSPSARHFIKLAISAPQKARTITVSEYQVTRLSIEVRDPDNQPLQTIDWQAAQGSASYLIPVQKLGQHEILVTHFGEQNGQTVQATETTTCNIGAMLITVIEVVPGAIGMIDVAGEGGPPPDPLAWLYGSWVQGEVAAPWTDVLTINQNGTFESSDNYDGSGVGWIGSGTWTYHDGIFTFITPGGPIDVSLTKISDDQFSAVVGPDTVDLYRKGTQPGGWVFDQAPIVLPLSTGDEWTDGSLLNTELRLYSFQAPADGDYRVEWQDNKDNLAYSASIAVSAYAGDKTTPFFVEEDTGYYSLSPLSLSGGETIYIIVDPRYEPGSFAVRVQQ